jgi:hypothetical protein
VSDGLDLVANAESLCTKLRTARYLLILETAVAAVMLSLVIWLRIRTS